MKIGIDISQLADPETGVANYLEQLVRHLLEIDKENEYVLFFSSLRKNFQFSIFPGLAKRSGAGNFQSNPNVSMMKLKIPPTLLDFLWNRLHILPIENLIGDVDWFITSDWTEPPVRGAKKATIVYDLIVYKHPSETDHKIVSTQRRKLEWVKKESDIVFTISEASKKDIEEILKIDSSKIKVIYPGIYPVK